MVNMKILESIFRDIFDNEDLIIRMDTSSADIEDWDSLAQINLILAIQDEFGINFNLEEIFALKNVGDIYNSLQKKLNSKNI